VHRWSLCGCKLLLCQQLCQGRRWWQCAVRGWGWMLLQLLLLWRVCSRSSDMLHRRHCCLWLQCTRGWQHDGCCKQSTSTEGQGN
jgi:hypothetical protein